MRVTSNSYSDSLISHLSRIGQRHSQLQTQIASGQRIQSAEDDPMAMQQVLKLRDESAVTEQHGKNIQNLQEVARASHGVMKSLTKILDRAQEIAQRVDGLDSTEDMQSYAAEVEELIKQAVHTANTKFRGEYLLSGTRSATEAFTAQKDAEGRVTSVAFTGNAEMPELEISPGVTLSSRVAGASPDGAGERGLLSDDRFDADFFGHLIELHNNLLTGDKKAIADTSRGQLQADEENLLYHVANNAALQSRLEASLSSNKESKASTESDISRRADVDIAETIVRLNQAQTSYQAALQSGGAIMNLTLLDFLR